MKKFKRATDIIKGLIVIAILGLSIPFVVYSLIWYCFEVWKMFF